MIIRSDRQSLIRDGERLMRWKQEAMEVLARWDAVADKVPKAWMPLGKSKAESTGRYIEHLEARIAELQAIPPHPAYLPWVKTDLPVIVKTETGWVHIGPEAP
jgi:cell wall assembly regulator SMI1